MVVHHTSSIPIKQGVINPPDKSELREVALECNKVLPRHELCRQIHTSKRQLIQSFFMDRYEVTVQQYRNCISHKKCSSKPIALGPAAAFSNDHLPMTWVSLREAKSYCAFAGGTLPSLGQWQNAFKKNQYPWGNRFRANRINHGMAVIPNHYRGTIYQYAVRPQLMPEGSDGFSGLHQGSDNISDMTPDGVYHLGGNAAEWTDEKLQGLSVVKGASWLSPAYMAHRLAYRLEDGSSRFADVGFRCVRPIAIRRSL